MSLRINTNVNALAAHRFMAATDNVMGKAVQKLSSGFRINSAADDPAGLVISEGFRAIASGLGQALANTQHATNLVKTAEGALQEVNNLLRTMRDVTVHAANTGVNDADALAADQAQIDKMVESIDRVATNTQFGTVHLLDNTNSLTFQLGAYSGQTVTLTLQDVQSTTLAVGALDVSTDAGSAAALTAIDAAISTVSSWRAELGAFQSGTLESTANSLSVAQENITASESTIRDADMAAEMVTFTKSQIIMQAGASMIAQANQSPQYILKMLG